MGQWYKCEFHSHTKHSDGHFTVRDLYAKGKERGLDMMALTDHNTISGWPELDKLEKEILPIKALEWTTFYGHIVLLGIDRYYDWTHLSKYNLKESVEAIRDENLLVGMAHPRRIGDPISTGSEFVFEGYDESTFDYMEVWSRQTPLEMTQNQASIALWHSLLNKGYKLPGIHASDWHGGEVKVTNDASTYIYSESCEVNPLLQGLKQGRVQCGYGRYFDQWLLDDLGDKVPLYGGEDYLKIGNTIVVDVRMPKQGKYILRCRSNEGISLKVALEETATVKLSVESQYTWLYFEVAEIDANGQEVGLGLTNPLYCNPIN